MHPEFAAWRRTITCLLTVASFLALPSSTHANTRLPRNVLPVEQSLTLKLDADRPDYSGSTVVLLNVLEPTQTLQFHSVGLSFERIELEQNGKLIPTNLDAGNWEIVTLKTSSPLAVGEATLRIGFTNAFDTTAISLYRMVTDDQGYCFTQFESDDAREAFPCWDEPSFKIPYQLTISVPEPHIAITNMPSVRETVGDGWRTYDFKKSPPMPSYLIAIATGPLELTPIPGMSVPGNVVCVKGKSHLTGEAVKTAPPLLAAMEKYFGSKYPYDKLDLIAVPEFWPGGMENPGAITFAESILLHDPATISVGQKRALAEVAAHEFAHMWFGDLVTMEWWDDLWLNESFASWMGDKITHEVFPEYGVDVSAIRSASMAMVTDARPSTRAIRQPIEATDNLLQTADELAYNKGEAVLGMFEAWLGPEAFREGVIDYIKSHSWRNATADDLWAALSKASGRDFASTMATFIDQPGVPLVSAELTLDGKLRLEQTQFTSYGNPAGAQIWAIPVAVKYADRSGAKTQTVMLDDKELTVALQSDGPPQWIMPNAGAIGYYRWIVPPQIMARLAENATELLDATERVGLIGNASALLDAGAISGDEYLHTLNKFADDPDPQVISTMLSGLNKVQNAFVTEELEHEFSMYVRRTLKPAIERFGWQTRPGEDEEVTRFRPQLIQWLGEEGNDPQALAYADSLAAVYMHDPTAVDPALVNVAVLLSVQDADKTMFEECKRRFETAQVPQQRTLFLSALGHFRDPSLVQEALAYSLSGPLRPNEFFYIPFSVGAHPKYQDLTFEWQMANYEAITSRMPPMFASFMPYSAGGCSRERLAKAQAFYTDPSRIVPGMEETLAKVADQVNDCAGLREREGAKVAAYLKRFVAAEE